jgi:sugar phosphate isomerase/epimerase
MISNLHAGDRNLLGANGEPSFISSDAEGRTKRIRTSKDAIDLCAELGAEIAVVTSGALGNEMTISDSWRYLEDGIGDCIEHARRTGVLLLIEPEPELFIRSTFDFLTLFRSLDSPVGLGLNLDIGHSHCLFEDTPAVIRETQELLMHVHLEDISNRQHKHLMPGEGDVEFSPVRDALQDIGYSRCVSVELYDHFADPWKAARQAKEFLSSWAAATVSDGQRG